MTTKSKRRAKLAAEPAGKSQLGEIGATGLAEFSGILQTDFLRELRGLEGYKRFDEMRLNSPVIGGLLLAITQPIRGMTWTFASDAGDTDPRLELLADAQRNMTHSMNDHVSEALTMLPFGYSVFEIVYERVDARILWRKFGVRGQDTIVRWRIDDAGGLVGIDQRAAPKYQLVSIPIEKLLLYRMNVERNNPEGRSLLRPAWVPYYFTKHVQQVEAIGIERDLAGLPSITLPEDANTKADDPNSDFSVASKVVRNIRNDEQAGIVLPFGWEFSLVSTGGSRQFDTDKTIRRYESRMLMAALAQFLLLGQDGAGSLALSKDQTDFFTMSVNAVADIISQVLTKYAIPRLMALNGYDADGLKIEHTPAAGNMDLTILSQVLQAAGDLVSWNAEDEVWLRSVVGMPERSVEDLQAEQDAAQARREAALEALRQGAAGAPGTPPGQDPAQEPPADITKAAALRLEAAQAAGAVFEEVRAAWLGLHPGQQPTPEKLAAMHRLAEQYAAGQVGPADDRRRRRRERDWKAAIGTALNASRKRVLKAMKEAKR